MILFILFFLTQGLLAQFPDMEYETNAKVGYFAYHITENNRAKVTAYLGANKENVSIPEKIIVKRKAYIVDEIGSEAFKNNTTIRSIQLPNTILIIQARAFEKCTNLEKITLSDSLLAIKHAVFLDCKSLESIELPASLQKIGFFVFGYCTSLSQITVHPENKNFSSEDGVLFSKNKDTLYMFPPNKKDTLFDKQFSNIREGAFQSNKFLKSIVLPDALIEFSGAINDCQSLEKLSIGKDTRWIDFNYNLQGCPNLLSIEVHPDNNYFISNDGVLYSKDFSTLLKCPQAKTNILIHEETQFIENYALMECIHISEISFPSLIKKLLWKSVYGTNFTKVTFTSPFLPEGVYTFTDKTQVFVPKAFVHAYKEQSKNKQYWESMVFIAY